MVQKSIFKITKMDCPSEEQVIRLKLADLPTILKLDFDIAKRQLTVYHKDQYDEIFQKLDSLNFGTSLILTETDELIETTLQDKKSESSLLIKILLINLLLFFLEAGFGYISASIGLVADSLDMLADSIVYLLALYAVGGSAMRKKNISKAAGYFQLILAILGLIEVIKRFVSIDIIPDFQTMISISIVALAGNAFCLYLLQQNKSNEVHMRASMIFTSNDVIVNLGVICAGILVNVSNSKLPDLIVGSFVFILVGNGAIKILKL